MQQTETATRHSLRHWLLFLLPSLMGVFLFMVPIQQADGVTIPIAALAKWLKATFALHLPLAVTVIVVASAILSTLYSLYRWKTGQKLRCHFFASLFEVTPVWLCTRILGAIFIVMTYRKWGTEMIYSGGTGGLVLNDLLPLLLAVFTLAGLLLPLLLNFGLLELFGTLFTKLMRPVFGLPGSASVNCIASWLGDGSVGVLLTSKQYQAGQYTEREAAIIGTTFSAVSITFCFVVLSTVKLSELFLHFYLTVCFAGVIAAIVVPRLPPLSRKRQCYIDGRVPTGHEEDVNAGESMWRVGLDRGLNKAAEVTSLTRVAQGGLHNALDMVFGVLPIVMAVGTIALMIAEYTPVFDWLGMPFVPLLEALHLPEAQAASKTIMIGFADMFVPAILASTIESDMTRFVIAALSVTQLIYMSEIGALMLGSKIPVNVFELFVIFILRTLVTLPVIVLMAHLIFGYLV
ncbi:hypothetical protein VST7929_02669 [Vibrio stylophorae]|uniref:Nucleoside transporter/FeoB GTPase Gate domain-containing protein n=1 Tax=Vibrio stylophorae TaxID=659351 RepID=A0ABM8ZWK2_9VIBR|nr:YjiH family protein [Vibrio stylophorae]CAH0534719.1 hypothetical protein VST7929_02669 [Vibrio stylophorae]